MKCKDCGADNKPGAMLCEACGTVLPDDPNVAAAAPKKAPTASAKASSSGIEGRACVLVENNKITDKEFELPPDDFRFMAGRPDLDQGIIPDVDLTKFVQKVSIGVDTGYTISRKQANVSRKMGRLYLQSLGGAKTMLKPLNDDWRELKKDEEVELHLGWRFRFGGSEGYVIFEVV